MSGFADPTSPDFDIRRLGFRLLPEGELPPFVLPPVNRLGSVPDPDARTAELCIYRAEIGEGCCAATTCKPGGLREGQTVKIYDCLLCVKGNPDFVREKPAV